MAKKYKIELALNVDNRDELMDYLRWAINHVSDRAAWDAYLEEQPYSSTLYDADDTARKQPVGKLIIAPSEFKLR